MWEQKSITGESQVAAHASGLQLWRKASVLHHRTTSITDFEIWAVTLAWY